METVARLRAQQRALVRLASRSFASADAMAGGLVDVARVAADVLAVGRVGIWVFAADGTALQCVQEARPGGGTGNVGRVLHVEAFPRYFGALADARTLVADDARTDLRTSELDESYLAPQGIGAMMDTPIRIAGDLRGIVCCEHVGGPRTWTEDEQAFAGAVADIVALTLEGIDRHRAEEALREQERRFRAIFACTPIGGIVMAPDGTIENANAAIADLLHTNHHVLERTDFFGLVHPEDVPDARREFAAVFDERVTCAAFEHRLQRGSEIVLVRTTASMVTDGEGGASGLRGEPLAIAMLENVTARRAAQRAVRESEARLFEAQKMDAVGRLAGETAIEFTDLLTLIRTSAQLALRALPPGAEARDQVLDIDRTAEAAGRLTRQLLALSRKQPTVPRLLDLNVVIARLRDSIRDQLGEAISLDVSLDPELGLVHADESEVEQILRILTSNARDAMPAGGRLSISTCNASIEPRSGMGTTGPVPHACLRVSDTGQGVEPALATHLFEPYYTTSESGKGAGLGLSMAYAMARRNGGDIQVETAVGAGSTFIICLPHA